MDCGPSGSSVHGIFQARVLEWIAISFSRGSFRPRNRSQVSRIAGRRFYRLSLLQIKCDQKAVLKPSHIQGKKPNQVTEHPKCNQGKKERSGKRLSLRLSQKSQDESLQLRFWDKIYLMEVRRRLHCCLFCKGQSCISIN